jgi:broad specificity phosphatase PhoE
LSTLHLVRHAQASFLASDYDVLSELGHRQARALGEHWARLGMRFHAVYSGPRRRQIHTAELAGAALSETGLDWPEIVVLEELDEYRAEELLERRLLEIAAERPEIGALLRDFQDAADPRARRRGFERVLQGVLKLWARAELSADGIESFSEFDTRLKRGLATLTRGEGRGRQVAAFSSSGAIGALVGGLLGATPGTQLELGWTLNNCGVTELFYSDERITLSRYNQIGHLTDPSAWTYR